MSGSFSWFVDVINNSRISGWCFSNDALDEPTTLSIFGDGENIGTIKADQYREDLKNLKFHPTGICGFEFTIPEHVDVTQYKQLSIHADIASEPLKEFASKHISSVLRGKLPKVFFMHIPKTAGTSFNAFADTVFPKNTAAVHIESRESDTYQALQTEKYYLAGHIPLREIKTHFDLSKFDLYTIIREPFSHLHSHLKWVKRIGQDPGSDFFSSHSIETQKLALLLNQLDFAYEKNVQAVVNGICGDLTTLFDNHQTRYFLDYKRKNVSPPDVQIARSQLKYFKAIGVTEQYPKFLDQFCQSCGITYSAQEEKLNQSESPQLFDYHDQTVRSILRPLVEFDLLLYQEVMRLESS